MESVTGVFYQAMPAVGPDGKNVMKLIPVQKVNGQYIPMQTPYGKINGPAAQTVLTQPIRITAPSGSLNKVPVVEPTSDGRFILKGPTNTNIGLIRSQQQMSSAKMLVGQMRLPTVPPQRTQNVVPLPVKISETAVATQNTTQLPVTVRSPRLPNGHYLQIPPDAKVKTLPASALPQSIKKRILDLPHGAATTENSSTVVYVSPVNSMKMDTSKFKESFPFATQNSSTLNVTSKAGSASSQSGRTVSPKLPASDCGTPMKWVVQQKDHSSAPCLVPASPVHMASEILKAVAQMEKQHTPRPLPSEGHQMISPGKEDALVMCNGKVYFVTKKDSGLCVSPQEGDTTVKECSSSRKQTVSPNSSSRSHTKATNQGSQSICIVDDPKDDVIDLCDDDPQTDGTSGTGVTKKAGVTTEEEDDSTVIFVSYIPPKTSTTSNAKDTSGETNGVNLSPLMPVSDIGKVTNQVNKETENCASGKQPEIHQGILNATPVSGTKNRIDLTTEEPGLQEQEMATNTAQPPTMCKEGLSLNTNKLVKIAEIRNDQNSEDRVHLQASLDTITKDTPRIVSGLEVQLAPARMESKSIQKELSVVEDVQSKENTRDTALVQSLSETVNPSIKEVDRWDQHDYDSKMRQLFGITKDVKVCLTKIHSPKKGTPTEIGSINKRTLEGIRKLIQGSQMEIKAKKLIEAQVHLSKDAKRRKVESSREPSERSSQSEVTNQPHISPKCGLLSSHHNKNNSLTHVSTVQNTVPSASSTGESTIVPADLLVEKGFNVDITDDTARLQDSEESAAKRQEDPGESPSSIVEPFSSHIDISTQAGISEKSDIQPGEVLKGGEQSQLGKKSSCSASMDRRNTIVPLNEELFSTEAMEPEEIKQCEKIKRLKELLKQKEAALEMMRRKMSM